MPPAPHTPAAEAQDHAALIVALDAGDLAGAELRAAESLATSCTGCAALVHDLAAIRGAMTALPVPLRRRDYRLTAADAARLRPSSWRRLLEWLAAPASAVRPLATGLATLGVVGLLVTSGLPGLLSVFGGSTAAPALAPAGAPRDNAAPGGSGDEQVQGTYGPAAASSGAPGSDPGLSATAAPAPVATGAPAPVPTAAPSGDRAGLAGEAATADPTVERGGVTGPSDDGAESGKAAGRDAEPTVPLAALVSLALLAAGLALLAGRVVARRRLS
ncbi:MAG: hypothetical protein V2B17_07725 [Chloroflexota bacterium]